MAEPFQDWHIHHGDCIPHMQTEMEPASMDFAVFSPPFPSLFAYTSQACDIGNSENLNADAKLHLSFFYQALQRVIKPGRVIVVHLMQIPALKRNDRRAGIYDFRGLNIRLAERAGLIYEYDWLVRKNPQAQAIRTHSDKLLFVTLKRDRAKTTGALADYLIKFRVPGDNAVPINSLEISNDDWVKWAEAAWMDVRETETLNAREGRGEDDTKHICPLQLEPIRRLIRLYTNPGETVFSPFTGIGSEGYCALMLNRRFYGCEIKDEYVAAAETNLCRAIEKRSESTKTLWSVAQ